MKETAADNLRRRDSFKYALVAEGVLIGLITGALISVFRLMLTGADALRGRLVVFAGGGVGPAAVTAGVLALIALIIGVLLGAEPDIAGSGIPQVEAELRGQKDMNWLRVIGAKMAGCALAIGGGLALGREGPSIQLGSMVGKGVSRAGHRLLTEERLLITCGAGAGLSAAFGAPLAGALFALEELHRNFSAEVLLSTMAASAASEFVAANVFGLTPVFDLASEYALPLRYYWSVIILGIVLGFFGMLYSRTISFMQDIFGRATRLGSLICAFALAFILMFIYPDALGSGTLLVSRVSTGEYTLAALTLLLIIKFIFSTASFGSGSPGGIFLPLLVLGAVTGGVITELLAPAGLDDTYISAMVVIGMAGYFSAIVRAPVTGVVLITEMTGDFTCLLPLVLVSLIAYLIPEYFGVEPIYTQLMHRQAGRTGARRSRRLSIRERKTVIDAEVHTGSYMDGRAVMEFGLPLGTLIVSVIRDGIEIIPDGHTILRAGDALEILTRDRDIEDAESIIDERCKAVI